jgi:hypothetical protein
VERFLREGGRVVSLADRRRKRWEGRGVGKVWEVGRGGFRIRKFGCSFLRFGFII